MWLVDKIGFMQQMNKHDNVGNNKTRKKKEREGGGSIWTMDVNDV